ELARPFRAQHAALDGAVGEPPGHPRDQLQHVAGDAMVVGVAVTLPLAISGKVVEPAVLVDEADVELAVEGIERLDRDPEIPILDELVALLGDGWRHRRRLSRVLLHARGRSRGGGAGERDDGEQHSGKQTGQGQSPRPDPALTPWAWVSSRRNR